MSAGHPLHTSGSIGQDIRLFVVILHYGDPRLTRTLADELTADGTVVHVLDNAAPLPYEGAWQRLASNFFWAGALDVALQAAAEHGATHLWFCNNDVRMVSPLPHAPRVAARLARMAVGLGRAPGVYAPAVTRNPYHAQMVHRSGLAFSQVSYVDGIAPVFSLDCVRAVGGLDAADNPRGYGVDVWLSWRAHAAGWPVVVDHGVVVRHVYHTTAAQVPDFLSEAARDEHAYMTTRLGPEWRARLAALQLQQIDEATL